MNSILLNKILLKSILTNIDLLNDSFIDAENQ